MAVVYIGIGTNLGNREKNIKRAISLISSIPGVDFQLVSEFYTTVPVGGPPQGDYLNGVVKVVSKIPSLKLFEFLKNIETEMGRSPGKKNYPRVIDLDILIWDDKIIDQPQLKIPHRRMHKRYFVLRGFNEIAPEVIHPVLNKTIRELYIKCMKKDVSKERC